MGREVAWSIRFADDLAQIYRSELSKRHVHPKPGTSLSELARLYHKVVRARLEDIEGTKLRVRYSKEMKGHPRLAAIYDVANRARRGEELWPYLSKQTEKAQFNDHLFDHWGIVHFHLGEERTKGGYVKRTGDLLYTWIEKDAIYFLDIHRHTFADDRILNVIVRNWPHLLEPFRIRGSVSKTSAAVPKLAKQMERFTRTALIQPAPRLSEGQTTALRNAGVTPTFESETGAVYSPPGGGASCAGTGLGARIRADHEVWWAARMSDAVVSSLSQVIGEIERERGTDFHLLDFHIDSLESLHGSTVIEPNLKVRLHLPMEFDHNFDPATAMVPMIAAAASR